MDQIYIARQQVTYAVLVNSMGMTATDLHQLERFPLTQSDNFFHQAVD
jgi:hypothetical protein